MQSRIPLRALALACVLLPLGACNLTASQAEIQASLNPGTLTPSGLANAGLSSGQIQKATDILNQVRTATKTACGFLPTVTSVASIVAALDPSASAVTVPVGQVVSIACAALTKTARTSYAAGEAPEKPAKKAPAKPAEPKVGDVVTGTIIVNGVPVAVTGTKTK